MTDRELDELEDKVPAVAVAALNAASEAARNSHMPRVVVIGDGLYRISATGERELIRDLPPRVSVHDLASGTGK